MPPLGIKGSGGGYTPAVWLSIVGCGIAAALERSGLGERDCVLWGAASVDSASLDLQEAHVLPCACADSTSLSYISFVAFLNSFADVTDVLLDGT